MIGLDVVKFQTALNQQGMLLSLLAWKAGDLLKPKYATNVVTDAYIGKFLKNNLSDKAANYAYAGVKSNETRVSGYAAMQAGVGSMRRLRVTQGIYLPADLPIHGIFGSKDVIHS